LGLEGSLKNKDRPASENDKGRVRNGPAFFIPATGNATYINPLFQDRRSCDFSNKA
jgi:hypothetical protein